jgi:hypothetical protein
MMSSNDDAKVDNDDIRLNWCTTCCTNRDGDKGGACDGIVDDFGGVAGFSIVAVSDALCIIHKFSNELDKIGAERSPITLGSPLYANKQTTRQHVRNLSYLS